MYLYVLFSLAPTPVGLPRKTMSKVRHRFEASLWRPHGAQRCFIFRNQLTDGCLNLVHGPSLHQQLMGDLGGAETMYDMCMDRQVSVHVHSDEETYARRWRTWSSTILTTRSTRRWSSTKSSRHSWSRRLRSASWSENAPRRFSNRWRCCSSSSWRSTTSRLSATRRGSQQMRKSAC